MMEKNTSTENINQIKGYELAIKIKEILLSKFRAKKKFLSGPSLEKIALSEMADFVFDIFSEKLSLNKKLERQERYKEVYTLNCTKEDLTKNIWKMVSEISEYDVVSKGLLPAYTYNLFKIENNDLKVLDRRLRAKAKKI